MGLLLMSYEYQRAKQKCNTLELRSIRLNDMQERYQKRIANIEKLFSKKKTSLETKYTNLQHTSNAKVSQMSAAGSFDVGSIFGGINDFAGTKIVEASLISQIATNTGKNITIADGADNSTINQALAQRSAAAAQLQSMLQTIISALKEAALEELEALEDRQREPIAEKDAEIQADVAANDTALELAKQREEAAKRRLGENVKNSVAHYGLS